MTGILQSELEERRGRLLDHVRDGGLGGYVLVEPDYIRYFTGFVFLSNERPIMFAESASGETAVFVPEFEVERTRAESTFERIESYPEDAGVEHPVRILARVLPISGSARRSAPTETDIRHPRLPGPAALEVTSARVSRCRA